MTPSGGPFYAGLCEKYNEDQSGKRKGPEKVEAVQSPSCTMWTTLRHPRAGHGVCIILLSRPSHFCA